MSTARVVEAELLDTLAPEDPQAQRSRRDLQRVHRVMGTCGTLLKCLSSWPRRRADGRPWRVLELGAGDGSLMLRVARGLGLQWPHAEITLLDRQPVVSQRMVLAYAECGWQARTCTVDVLDWARTEAGPATPHWDLIIATLFLHHFETRQLQTLLAAVAARSERFIACEPRRSALALVGSHLICALGVNAVTRADAVASVRAGFKAGELSALWPPPASRWQLREFGSGAFSQCLVTQRSDAPGRGTA